MRALLDWIDDRTGLSALVRNCLDARIPGGACWCRVWPATIGFAFCVQLITGFFMWMYYSPGAQTAWESVYFLQYKVAGGWLLRAMHHWSAQVLLVLIAVYLVQMIVTGAYRAPRELVFCTVLLMTLVTLGLLLTGDLLAWDQNSYASTQTRVNFLELLPWIGGGLIKLAAGGPQFGHLTLSRFLVLHICCLSGSFLLLLVLHVVLGRRADAAKVAQAERTARFWPHQAVRNVTAMMVVLVVILMLSVQHGVSGDDRGVELGSPADTSSFFAAARPEWAFRGLYQFSKSKIFSGESTIVAMLPIFVIPGLLVLIGLAMPWIARWPGGHPFNLGFTAVVLVGVVVLSLISVWKDLNDEEHQAALKTESEHARRAVQLARAQGIPATGALTLLRNDPKTQGPTLCKRVCASCHNYGAPEGNVVPAEKPSAPELYGFATRQWLADLLDSRKIKGPEYYGNTRFARGVMVRYVEGRFSELKDAQRNAIIAALSAEARLESQQNADRKQRDLIEKGRQLMAGGECTRCHRYRGQGPQDLAPDLTGYGSREWIVGIVANPAHAGLYGKRNDHMPAYLEFPDKPADNLLAAREVAVVADWLRGEWYEAGQADEAAARPDASQPARKSIAVLLDRWESRRPEGVIAAATGPQAEARRLFKLEHCSICHDFTDAEGGEIIAADPSAPDLGGFADRRWISGLLDPKQIKTRKYFGNSKFRRGEMANFVEEIFSDMEDGDKEDLKKLVIALSAEARLPSQRELDERDAELIEEGRQMLVDDFGCTDCHRFHGEGGTNAPDLTGYGSREWLASIISDPAHKRFYGRRNDGMPSYLAFPDQPGRNLLTADQIEALVDLIRGESDATKGR